MTSSWFFVISRSGSFFLRQPQPLVPLQLFFLYVCTHGNILTISFNPTKESLYYTAVSSKGPILISSKDSNILQLFCASNRIFCCAINQTINPIGQNRTQISLPKTKKRTQQDIIFLKLTRKSPFLIPVFR